MNLFVAEKISREIVIDIVKTPLWWYQEGLPRLLRTYRYWVLRGNAVLGFMLWVRHIFSPMFGQRDWQGRLISVFMRVVNIIGRGAALVALIAGATAVVLLWIAAPILLLFGLLLSAS